MLERLQLGNHQSLVPDLGALRYLIHCLPPNLSYLGLSIYFAATTDPNQWRRLLLEAPNTKPTKIKELFIDGNMQGLEGSLFMALIKRSHHLEKISISSSSEDFISELSVALKENCPKLTKLAVGYTERPIRDREWASLLGASQGWREVSILRVTRFGSFAREALLGHAETLESVSISMCLGFPEQFFLTLLKLCPKLKALNRFNYDNKDNYVIRPISFSATNIACTGSLKFLRISLPFPSPRDRIASLFDQLSETIGNVHQATSQSQVYLANSQQIQPITTDQDQGQDQAITTDAQQPPQAINPFHAVIQQLNQYPELSQSLQSNTVTLQHHVFQRLASLTELEELWLGESDPHQMSVEHLMLIKRVSLSPEHTSAGLKFTLDEGLDTLEGMKKLKVLGVRGLAHGIGVLELEWMVHHWPKLEKIDGLFSEKEDPEMRLWLKDNAPYLQF
ncbi:hypothetical protein BGZ49_000954 [Haplosporangium sp. Z 27]|nr:hypothetical protein BGZ49_000954 [Haplosporangium sp. Z 27]